MCSKYDLRSIPNRRLDTRMPVNEVFNYQTQEWVEAEEGVMYISSSGEVVFEDE